DARTGQMPKDPARARATVESTADLQTWLRFMAARLRDAGTLSIIHRADRADEIIALLGDDFGHVRRLDLISMDDGRPVKRCIVQATRGAAPGLLSKSAMVLHNADGSFTDQAQAVLRDGQALTIS
ncbi:MAG: methyltransferase, partial [Rhodospirillales bacterium]